MELKSSSTRTLDYYREIHLNDERYGRSSQKLVDVIVSAVRHAKGENRSFRPRTILDFGCGKSKAVDRVARKLGLTAYRYDPGIPSFEKIPVETADLVMNTDVLEHLDRGEVDLLLEDVRRISPNAFFNIATAPAGKHLANGENAHATVEEPDWWAERLLEHFPVVTRLPAAKHRVSFVTWSLSEQRLRRLNARYLWKQGNRGDAIRKWLRQD